MFNSDESVPVLVIFILVTSLTSAIACFLHYIGVLRQVKVKVGKPVLKNVWIAYKKHVGPYKDCGPHFSEIVSLCPTLDMIGIYYDDPKVVPQDKLRYILGVVLCGSDEKPPQSVVTLLSSHKFSTFQLPSIDYAVKTTFPCKFNLCNMIAPWKVYPALNAYMEEHKLSPRPFIELYSKGTIYYTGPLSKQKDFYVPEVDYNVEVSSKPSPDENDENSQATNVSDEESQGTASSFEEISADQIQ